MRRYLIRYLTVAAIFLVLDSTWLGLSHDVVYKQHLGGSMLDMFRPVPAALFYLLYVAGVVFFAVDPADRTGRVSTAAARGAFFGLVAYGTYDLTNAATLTLWSNFVTVVDMVWGTVATALASAIAYALTRHSGEPVRESLAAMGRTR
jgi:uncharacterized membrane protein